ncbi:YbaB/EbfC family nucleoid-associated protein [Thermopirellula anaerolimosa]
MLKELSSLAALLRNAQEIGERMKSLGRKLSEERLTGAAGSGLVQIVLDGTMEPKQISIDPQLLRENSRELLEELVLGAMKDAVRKARARHAELLQELSGGMNLPLMDGLKDLLAPRPEDDAPSS